MEASVAAGDDGEAQVVPTSTRKRGGWITFPFIIATRGGLSLAGGGWTMNLMVYLIGEFNVKSIDAAQIFNIVNGCTALFPILGAVVADSFLGCFSVIWISSLFSLLGVVLITVTSTHDSLRPPHCETGSSLCKSPSPFQLSILYSGLALGCLGVGGTRYTVGTMGANQFDNSKNQGIFFNWYFFTMYASIIVSVTAIVYIEDSVSWVLGFGLSVLANLLGFLIFVMGNRFYRHVEANGSPFTGLARVIVAAIRKRSVLLLSVKAEDYYQEQLGGVEKVVTHLPTKSLKFLNNAAVKTQGDIKLDGSLTMEVMHSKTSRRPQSPNQNHPTMVNWYICIHSYSNPRKLSSPTSSNHGSSHWTLMANESRMVSVAINRRSPRSFSLCSCLCVFSVSPSLLWLCVLRVFVCQKIPPPPSFLVLSSLISSLDICGPIGLGLQ